MQSASAKQWLQYLGPYLIILVAAVVLTLPAAISPFRLHDSFWIDWVWADQFADELRQGDLYPRWLPRSHDGLGSPVFYYYPPLAFYLTSIFSFLGASTYGSILWAFGAGFALSGLTMFHWLKDWATRPLFGALIFMAAPYHLLDLYARGALAEFTGIAFIPLVALGLRRIAEGKGVALLALSYAGLIATHLPLALLTSLLLVAPYALILARSRWSDLFPIAVSLALGIALASIYLIPALALDAFRDSDSLWASPEYKPAYWSFLTGDWSRQMKVLIAIVTAALALPALLLAVARRSGWAVYAALMCVVVAGLVPFFWSLPLVTAVQFPFRALPLAEFGLATALACISGRIVFPALLAAPGLLLSLLFLMVPPPNGPEFTVEWMKTRYPDVPEYLPRGERPPGMPSLWAIEVAADNRSLVHEDGVTIEPVFYYPSWRVECQGRIVETFPAPDTQLLAYRGADCTKSIGHTRAEMIGGLLGLAALLALILMQIWPVRWPRRHSAEPR